MAGNWLVGLIVLTVPSNGRIEKPIVFCGSLLIFASRIAWRKDPGPSSSVVVTVKVAAWADPTTKSGKSIEIVRATELATWDRRSPRINDNDPTPVRAFLAMSHFTLCLSPWPFSGGEFISLVNPLDVFVGRPASADVRFIRISFDWLAICRSLLSRQFTALG